MNKVRSCQMEMLDKLQEKNKLWGMVLGRIVQAKLEKITIKDPDFMYRANDFWSHFTVLLYNEGLVHEKDGTQTQEQFW